MNRLSLPQRLTVQLVVVLTLVLAIDNVRIPAGVEADSRGRQEKPQATSPATTEPDSGEQTQGNDGRDPSDPEDRGNDEKGNCGGGNGTESGPVGNSGVSCPGDDRDDATTTAPETTVPETTTPETTVPETTVPETTVPETTTPETTVPETTVPETTVPETTVPETTVPDTTVPGTSIPDTSVPRSPSLDVATPGTDDVTTDESIVTVAPVVEQPVATVVIPPSTVVAPEATQPPTTLPVVTLENGGSELQVESRNGTSYVVSATPPPNLFGSIDLDLRLASRVNQAAVDLGYVSVRLAASDLSGGSVSRFANPVRIKLQQLPRDGIVAMSSDEFEWQPIPRLGAFSLADDQSMGYFVDVDGAVVILTKQTGLVGIRKQRPALEILDVRNAMAPGSATKLSVMGQIGEDPVVLSVSGSGTTCVVSETGVLRALDGGVCSISAVQGGGSMYMSASAPVVTAAVDFVEQLQETVVRYRTSISMLLVVVLLVLFLLWQMGQTVVDVRRALHTDPEAL